MVIQFVRFESSLPEEEAMQVVMDRVDRFRALPGLIQKYYVKIGQPNQYGGIYVWDSMESLSAFRESDLAAGIPAAYKVKGVPTVEILDTFLQLRE